MRTLAVLASCLCTAAGCWLLAGRGRMPGPPAAPLERPAPAVAPAEAPAPAAAQGLEPPPGGERRDARPPPARTGSVEVTPPDPFGSRAVEPPPREALERELAERGRRIAELELELDLCAGGARSAIGRWLATLPPAQSQRWKEAEPELLRRLGALLADFPILLYDSEVEWLMERVRRGEWNEDEVVLFLGPERLERELDERELAVLRRRGHLD